MLKYSLIENLLTKNTSDYMAKTHAARCYDKDAIITDMLRRGSLLTRTDILAVLNGFEESIAGIIDAGGTVHTPLFNTSFSISGIFDGAMDTFDDKRHKVKVNLTKGTLLRDTERLLISEKTETVTPLPQIIEVKDSVSGKVNELLTPGGVLEIWGNNIKIKGENPVCGLWFVSSSGESTKAQVIVQNKQMMLIAIIPPLGTGKYNLKVVTQFSGGGKILKEPKTNTYNKSLSV